MLQVNTKGLKGRLTKRAQVETNDPDRARFHLTLTMDLQPVFKLKPWKRLLISTPVGKPARQSVTLTRTELVAEPIKVVKVDHNLGQTAEVDLETVVEGKVYKLTLSTPAAEEIRRAGFIQLFLSGGPAEVFEVLAQVNVWAPKSKVSGRAVPAPQTKGRRPGQPMVRPLNLKE